MEPRSVQFMPLIVLLGETEAEEMTKFLRSDEERTRKVPLWRGWDCSSFA